MLRGQALQIALSWANEKNLSNEDARYLSASQELEKAELAAALATQEEEARILAQANEELRQAQNKSEQANQTLKKAQKKSQRMIRFGAGFLAVAMVGAIVASVFANIAQKELRNAKITRLEETGKVLSREISSGSFGVERLVEAIVAGRELQGLTKNNQSNVGYAAPTPVINLLGILLNIQERNRLEEHTKLVTSVAFSPDGKTLANGSWDNTIKLWNPTTGNIISTLKGHQ